MSMLLTDVKESIAIVKLNRSATNPFDLDLVNELSGILEKVKQDPGIHGLVFGSSGKFFSIGFDIQRMYEFSRKDFTVFFKAFNQVCLSLYTLPKPTVAAVTGHAIAGGCILILCCDYRFIGEGRYLVGLNEIKLGVPVPYLADCVLRDIVGTRIAKEIIDSGDFYQPGESSRLGLVDHVYPAGEVLDRAIKKAVQIGSWPQAAFAIIKRNRTEGVEACFHARKESKEESFIDCWYSDASRTLLKDAISKF
jgi:enoyl-CoA hydratase/carnithine racemase